MKYFLLNKAKMEILVEHLDNNFIWRVPENPELLEYDLNKSVYNHFRIKVYDINFNSLNYISRGDIIRITAYFCEECNASDYSLLNACEKGHLRCIDLFEPEISSTIYCYTAVKNNNLELLRKLINKGYPLSTPTYNMACYYKNEKIIELIKAAQNKY